MSDKEMIDYIVQFENKKKRTEEDINTYLSYMFELAKKDNDEALLCLGGLYYSGVYVKQDFYKAKQYYLKSIEVGNNPRALLNLGYIYYYGRCDGKPDYENAFKCYIKIALMNDVDVQNEALYKISDMYDRGYFVKQDRKYAESLIDPLLEQENLKEGMEEESVLGDILIRYAKFSSKDYQKENYDPYFYWKYNALANAAITERYDGLWFGDKELIKKAKEGIAVANNDCVDDIPYSKRNIDSEIVFKTLQDMSLFFRNWESMILPTNVAISKDKKNIIIRMQCFNQFVSIPEIGYADRIQKIDLIYENASSSFIGTLNIDEIRSRVYVEYDENKRFHNYQLFFKVEDQTLFTISFAKPEYQMHIGQIVNEKEHKVTKIRNSKYRSRFSDDTDIGEA